MQLAPLAHATQLVAAAAEWEFTSHGSHVAPPEYGIFVPAAHATQAAAPSSAATEPGLHGTQRSEPSDSACHPRAQG